MSFLLCIAQYLLIMVFILAVGALGAFIGITLRKRKNAKELANETESQDRNQINFFGGTSNEKKFWRK